ncbi:hypothetical protein O7623_26560 [Solwaraspora sp. WMMD791]|uniref:hypothetical protein n=1 Tax=Solwaraspora sp. WMMD791 TaxID=3016086 RepID=UPI00249B4858|nr:hypothetical protein [Solwaraspora sp. WMMD791]WFE26798.1 hypothetical protein O7623_26560 [Solwaraspora sp. WMMD791]
MKRIMLGATATGLVLTLFAAGCGSTDSDDADGTAPAGPAGSANVARPTFAERLALLPQRLADDEIVLQMADLDRAAELAGVTRPTDPADAEAVRSYLAALSPGASADGPAAVAALLPQQAVPAGKPDLAGFEAELGWSVLDVSWYAEHSNPPNVMTVLGGDFDSDRMTDAMGEPTDGGWQLGNADGSIDLAGRTVARPFGQPLHLRLSDGRLTVADNSETATALDNGAESFADTPAAVALAEAMDAEEAYSVLFRVGGDYGGGRGGQTLPAAFDGVAGGLAHDGAPVAVLAYAHADADSAKANAGALGTLLEQGSSSTGQPWSQRFTEPEVRQDGDTVVVRLRPTDGAPASIVYQLLQRQDSLITHE